MLQVPMRQVTLEEMESLLLRYKGRYTTVVGFKPTGWSHAGGSGRGAAGAAGPSRSSMSIKPNRRRSQRGTVVLYQVRLSSCGVQGGCSSRLAQAGQANAAVLSGETAI